MLGSLVAVLMAAFGGAQSSSFDDGAITLEPQRMTIPVGGSATATAAMRYPTSVHLPYRIFSINPGVAAAEDEIPNGQTAVTVLIRGVSPGEAPIAYYASKFGGGGGGTYIGLVTVVPCTPPLVAINPSSQTSIVGQRVVLSVNAASDGTWAQPYTYVWFAQEDGASSPRILDTHAQTFTTDPLYRATTFSVYVTTSCGAVADAHATVRVAPSRHRPVKH